MARNGGYGTRWSVSSIAAAGWTDAHINGAGGPGVLTVNNFPASALNQGQAAFNSGANNEGAVVGWNDIAPFPDGTFTITNQQYTGAIPGGTANGPYGYSFGAMMLAEVEVVAPTIISNPPAATTVEQNRPISLSVAATGAPLNYQWYKEGVGEIPGATFATYSIAQAALADSGSYYAVVYNSLARRTGAVAQVTVFADTAAPTVETIFSYPTVDAGGVATLNQIIIEFSEAVTPASVSSPANYTVPGGGNPASVIVTNERSVVLMLSTPLAENTAYSVTVSGATDAVGNAAGASAAPFRSWISGAGNGLLMESYNVEDPAITVESLLADPDYPNNPFRRDTLRAFDSRLVFPDNTQEAYGARIRGVFIPPVSGNWVFFARIDQLGVLYLNPNGTDEAGKVEILRQSTENAPFNWDRLSSSLVALRAGRAYYIEGLYKSAAAEDFMKVAARLAGTGTPMPVANPDTDAPDSNSLAGAAIAFPLAPHDLGGPLTIAQDLQDLTVEENHVAVFAPQIGNPGGLPVSYQWFRGGVEIPGANGPSYSLPVVPADSGATFSVRISRLGAATTNSRTATLTVIPDVSGPTLVSASSLTNLFFVTVRFSELMDPGLTQEPGNYQIENNSVTSATLEPDGRTVTLQLQTELTSNVVYRLEVLDLRDVALNVINPNPSETTFTAGVEQPSGGPTLRSSVSGGSLTLTWDAPARLQFTTSLTPPVTWQDINTGGATTFTVTPSNEFNILLDALQEPAPRGTGSGRGTLTLSNNVLVVDVSYSGMSGTWANSHFHAPAPRGVGAGVAYGTGAIDTGSGATFGTVKGTIPLANSAYGGKTIAAQVQDLRNGLWYLNIHSSTFTGGEIRGQVEPGARYYRLISP